MTATSPAVCPDTQQCTNILWAYGATQHYDSAAVTGILDRLHELLHTAVSDSLTAQESPRETWAPLTEEPGRADASEFPSLSEEAWALETASDGFPGQLVAHCLYSCAVLRHDPGLSFVRDASAHVQADLSSFAPSELCMTLVTAIRSRGTGRCNGSTSYHWQKRGGP